MFSFAVITNVQEAMNSAGSWLYLGLLLVILVGWIVLVFYACKKLFGQKWPPPPPDLTNDERCRRIRELDEKGLPVTMEAVDPDFARWCRTAYPWPIRWFKRKSIEEELTRVIDGDTDA